MKNLFKAFIITTLIVLTSLTGFYLLIYKETILYTILAILSALGLFTIVFLLVYREIEANRINKK